MPPTGLTVLDFSAYAGLAAVGAITLNMLLGLLMAFRYSPHRSWPHRRFNYFRFHNWTGYIALAVSIFHPVILLFSKNPRFRNAGKKAFQAGQIAQQTARAASQ